MSQAEFLNSLRCVAIFLVILGAFWLAEKML